MTPQSKNMQNEKKHVNPSRDHNGCCKNIEIVSIAV